MNTQPNAAPDFPLDSQTAAPPASMASTRPFYWSVRRELWENRYIYIAPLSVAAVAVFGFLIATIGRAMASVDLAQRRAVLEEPYTFAMGLIMAVAFVVGIFYSLEALHGERRDRSILFWKSLPVSDLITVLSKASIPLAVLPLLSFAIVVVTELIMRLLSTIVLLGSGLNAAPLWSSSALQMPLMLLYHLVTVHVLWHAPFYGWLLLVSGWARRAAILWATLPALAIGFLEKIVFHTTYFAAWLQYRLAGGPEADTIPGMFPTDSMTHLTLGRFLSTPGLWTGLIVAAALLAATVRLRRYREPI